MRFAYAALVAVVVLVVGITLATHPPGTQPPPVVIATSPAASASTPPQGGATTAIPGPATSASGSAAQATAEHAASAGSGTPPARAPVIAAATPPPASMSASGSPTAGGGDVTAGRQVFRKCQGCHSLDPGKNLVGPSLSGIIGKKSGSDPNFAYSPAMKEASVAWNRDTLDAYLADPQKTVPGNRMPFPGLKSDHDRADVIAFLEAQRQGAAPAAPRPTSPTPQTAAPATPTAAVPGYTGVSDVKYTLRTGIAEGRMVYLGVGGTIDGKINPVLSAAEGQVVQVTIINGEGAEHDIAFPDQQARSLRVTGKGASTTIAFRASKVGDFVYFCTVPGHRLAGMEGKFVVTPRPPAQVLAYADISREPTDLPPPLPKRAPQTVRVDLVTVEVEGRLAEGTTFGYWTFNGKVPGPFVRVRVGDTVEVHLKNAADSSMIHSVDFHAATGPGGGAAALQVEPGGEKSMTFKALVPGLYVYHCATPMVAEHIANGMYGLILVEPEDGLAKVDREFYLMQGEVYTDQPFGQHGSQEFSVEKLLAERPEYFVFNGSVGALTTLHPLHAKVGESVRLFFGVGGPNFTSSFHVIGEIFDKVYQLGGVISPPVQGIQTVSVAPGGAVITEFTTEVPGRYIIVDHALSRLERGLAGALIVEGPPNKEIYNGDVMPGGGGH